RSLNQVAPDHRADVRTAERSETCGARLISEHSELRIGARRQGGSAFMVHEEPRAAQRIAIARGDAKVERVIRGRSGARCYGSRSTESGAGQAFADAEPDDR